MLLCEELPTTAALQDLVHKIASLLESPEYLDRITKLPVNIIESAQPEIFMFEWNAQFTELANEVAKATVRRM